MKKLPWLQVYHGDDVDMDVEMELEDEILASPTKDATQGSHYYAPLEQQPVWIDPRAEQEAFVSGVSVPPPPDEDWVPPSRDNEPFPPPPPDSEPFPPPLPDNESFPHPRPEEPSESSYPLLPTNAVMAPSLTYAAQYNLSYRGSTLEYYGQTNPEVSESNIYASDPNQLTVNLPPYYYEAVLTTYSTTAPVVVNPVEPVSYDSYYGHQDVTVPPVSGFTCAESSKLHSASGEESIVSDQVSLDCQTFPNAAAEAFVVNAKTDKDSMEASFALVSDQATANISVTQGNPMSSAPPVSSAVAATAQKVQTKALRNKKRSTAVVSTLRSNTKVSSMVDKAAKEELHEEEDEPENSYEALEKKRQREIEEWRAQRIASGEAKDNSNFQPLGGDWRERVKRKRACLISKSIQASLEDITGASKQPDMDEISRDLPSGWQAYWDESTKQVYYGNSVTSKTWTRPS